jgi:ribonuclease BN (tRNA processing enzyme)
MSIHLAFLGTGTCNATGRNPSSAAITDGREVLCIDFGGGAYHQIARIGSPLFRYRDITTVFLTHFHVDHVSGLPDLFWGEMWDTAGRRNRPLTLVGPHGLGEFYRRRLLPFIGDHEIPFEVVLAELSDGEVFHGSFYTMQSRRLEHGERSTGYLFKSEGLRCAFTGDTGYCESLEELLRQSDCAVMEWGIQDGTENKSHLSGGDIMKLLKAGVVPGRVFITHMYVPPGTGFDELARRNKKMAEDFPVEFHFPADGRIYPLVP